MNGHTPECQEYNSRHRKEVEEYQATWPNYCKSCRGWGGSAYRYDPSPAGVALSPGYMYEWEPCPDCDGKCPRCAGPVTTDWEERLHSEALPCPHCGWNWGKEPGDAIADVECICPWEDDFGEYYDPNVKTSLPPNYDT